MRSEKALKDELHKIEFGRACCDPPCDFAQGAMAALRWALELKQKTERKCGNAERLNESGQEAPQETGKSSPKK